MSPATNGGSSLYRDFIVAVLSGVFCKASRETLTSAYADAATNLHVVVFISCKDAALQVLMSVYLVEIPTHSKLLKGSLRLAKVL